MLNHGSYQLRTGGLRSGAGLGPRVLAYVALVAALSTGVLSVRPLSAQVRGLYSSSADRLFEMGTEAYSRGDFESARGHFERLNRLPTNQRSSAGLLMLGRTLFGLEEFRLALDAARQVELDFPRSRYHPDARLIAGDCLYSLKRYYEAATHYGRLLATPAPLDLQATAAERLAAIAQNHYITEGALGRIRLQVGEARLRDALLFGEARWFWRLGWESQGREAMQTYLDSVATGIFVSLARRSLLESMPAAGGDSLAPAPTVQPGLGVEVPPRSEFPGIRPMGSPSDVAGAYGDGDGPRLGVLVPLSGSPTASKVGRELLDGVLFANEEMGGLFHVLAVDIGSHYGQLPIQQSDAARLMRVVEGARHLAEQMGVVAIIGPVQSSSCVAAACVAEEAGIPLIAPLAQQSGLDTLGHYVFQLNVIPDVEARALAEYATLVLGLETLVVLAPLTDYGWSFQRSFSESAQANGGHLLHSEWYYPGETTDFHNQFSAIRSVGFPLMPDVFADTLAFMDSLSLALVDTSTATDGAFLEVLQSASAVRESEPPDSAEIFIDSIDGVAIIVESFDDVETVAPQLYIHRLHAQMLGNDAWNEPEAIRSMTPMERDHIAGCVFVSSRGQVSPTRRAFTDAYRSRFGRDPELASFGYDAARLVISGWQEGNRGRTELRHWLAQVQDYEGASGRISFPPGRRANAELGLLKIDSEGKVRTLRPEDLPPIEASADADLPTDDLWESWESEEEGEVMDGLPLDGDDASPGVGSEAEEQGR